MRDRLNQVAKLPRKLVAQLALLRRDPEAFGRNLLQFTHPALFEERLINVMNAVPMHVRIDPALAATPSLLVLNSALTANGMTGGPNTIISLALRIARGGVPVRLVTTVATSSLSADWFARHAAQLLGGEVPHVEIVSAAESGHPLAIGPNDVFMATHWSTAQQLKPVLAHMRVTQFFYMLQEFEPAFYAWSSNHALALETLGMDFWPVFNEQFLADFMLAQPFGRLHDADRQARATVFEPAVDSRVFHPASASGTARPRRLLFYARPTNTRNLFGLGLKALRAASGHPVFKDWEFISIGSRGGLPNLALQGGHVLRPAPWMDYEGYAESLRHADVMLCPMLSPHTSYPVLEMVACGGLSVTNSFATKTIEGLQALSDNIIASEATVEGLTAGLLQAAERVGLGRAPHANLRMARDWAETLDPAAARISGIFKHLTGAA